MSPLQRARRRFGTRVSGEGSAALGQLRLEHLGHYIEGPFPGGKSSRPASYFEAESCHTGHSYGIAALADALR